MAACQMREFLKHIPVLLEETVQGLIGSPQGIYVDATFGRGGHCQALLNSLDKNASVIALDKDPEAIVAARLIKDSRLSIFHASFSELYSIIAKLNLVGKIDGIMIDLGVSSPQLDDGTRGFSFLREGKLDMRMDTTKGQTASEWLSVVSESELTRILWEYGEERFAKRIAAAIVSNRKNTPLVSTLQLANLVKFAVPKSSHPLEKHPATRTFQAIRIEINQELKELTQALMQAYSVLKVKGRLGVISFHSLEDRIVKNFIKINEKGATLPKGLPVKAERFQPKLISLGKPIKPSDTEINHNPRARSAVLRFAEKKS